MKKSENRIKQMRKSEKMYLAKKKLKSRTQRNENNKKSYMAK